MRLPALSALVLVTSTCSAFASADAGVCEREIISAAAKYDIPAGILYSVGLTETGRKGSLQPYAMNIEGKAYFGSSEQDVLTQFGNARAQGAKLIDLGCMQINYHYHGKNFRTLSEMLDPHRNVEYAARFLKELRASEGSWTMAVARYHAGPNNNRRRNVMSARSSRIWWRAALVHGPITPVNSAVDRVWQH